MKKIGVSVIGFIILGIVIYISLLGYDEENSATEETSNNKVTLVFDESIDLEADKATGVTSSYIDIATSQEDIIEPYYEDRAYHPDASDYCNFSLMISNQSFEIPVAELQLFINEQEIFKDSYEVDDQHKCYFYYFNLEGENDIKLVAEDGTEKITELTFTEGQNHYMFAMYWGKDELGKDLIEVLLSDEPILIKKGCLYLINTLSCHHFKIV